MDQLAARSTSTAPDSSGGEGFYPKPVTDSSAPASSADGTAAQDPPFTVQDRKQAETLKSVLAAHNDNDQRMDTELKVLGAGAKKLFQQAYSQIVPEKRNERGTVIFLLGRNISQASDVAFLAKVLSEPPCRSMQNCNQDPPHSADADSDNGVEVSLAYPQIVALKSLERVLAAGPGNPQFQQAMDTVHRATQSPVAKIAIVARAIEAKYSRH
jgi:hypothetical protein